ncbi:Protein TASOR, partial [Varanus komodoensis]
MQYELECIWQFEKIEILHNKFLEDEFVAKRTKLREEGKQDKELASFLVVSKDKVSTICQSGLRVGHAKGELNIMKELGNPRLGVYLFRYVDVALNYAFMYSFPVENIIVFRVLLGKVKKIQPPKGKKNVALDPTPNFDCHMSRNHPSLKDSLEDQAIDSLVYFYEYSELSRPVNKPRQCLPYAVIKVRYQKMVFNFPTISLKFKPKRLPNRVERRLLPLKNCTRVTRIGKSKLIYEHFRKPFEGWPINLNNHTSSNISSFSGSIQNWNGSSAETQHKKDKRKLTRRWDSEQMENEVTIQPIFDEDDKSVHMGNANKNALKTLPHISTLCDSGSSTVITSRLIKDPRLAKRELNLGKQSGETMFHGNSQSENEMKISANPMPEEFFLLDAKHELRQRQYIEKTAWKEKTSEE